jgi:type I restriction enzyme S subunit
VSGDVMVQAPLVQHFDLIAQAPGGVARLRELILTLAVQGKLVPQDLSDEPASELLKKIRAEKDRLIAEGKIKRDKPLAEIADEEKPCELPNGWEWVRLGEIVEVLDSLRKPVTKEDRNPGPYPYFGASGIVDYVSSYIFDEPLVLVGEDGAKWGAGDKTAFPISGKTWVNNHAHVLRPRRLAVLDLYLVNFLTAKDLSEFITGMTVPKLNQARLVSIPIALPPLAEQSRIVTRVEELMQLCDALEASGQLEAQQHAQLVRTLLDTLTQSETPEALADNWQRIATHFDVLLDRPEAVDALEQTILQLAVRGLLVPQDPTDEPASVLLQKIRTEKDHLIAQGKIKRDKPLPPITDEEKPFELPQGWELARFGELAQISSGVTLGRKTPISKPLLLPYLRVANVQRWVLKLDSMKEVVIDEKELDRFQVCKGDLLITEGGDWDKVGRTAIWQDQLQTCVHQNHVFKARGVIDDWCPEWAELFLNSDVARSYFAASAKQTTNLASINMTELKNCVFPFPPRLEQVRIVKQYEALRCLCADLRIKLSASQSAMSSIGEAVLKVE